MNAKQRRRNDRHDNTLVLARLSLAKQTIAKLEQDGVREHKAHTKLEAAHTKLEAAHTKLGREFRAVQTLEDVVREALKEARAETTQLHSEVQQLTSAVASLQAQLADAVHRADENAAVVKEAAKLRRRLAAREQQAKSAEANRNRKAVTAALCLAGEQP